MRIRDLGEADRRRTVDAIMPLYPWQSDFLTSPARLKLLLKGRQTGGSTIGTLAVAHDAIMHSQPYNAMSRTGRQAKRLLAKVAIHVRAIDRFLRDTYGVKSVIEKDTTEEIQLTNGAVISSVPCDADTTVGDTVNWLLDEFALYPDSDMTFGKIKPSIMHGKKMMIVSSPRGRGNKFYKIFADHEQHGAKSGWQVWRITIEDAIHQGLRLVDHLGKPITFEQFRDQEIHDVGMEMWMQEYMCSFHDLVSSLVSYELIGKCSVLDETTVRSPSQIFQAWKNGLSIYGGLDIGRFHDITVFWLFGKAADGSIRTLATIPLDRADTPTQIALIASYMETGAITNLCVDYNGIGVGTYDGLNSRFPGSVEKVAFTNTSKMEMSQRLLMEMQARNVMLPKSEDIEEDFASIEKVLTDQGNVRLEARRGGKTHGDYWWAACLALRASSSLGEYQHVMAAA